ncbi:MAG: glycosyltransferase family 87 protein [Xanthobacteraceae bacterium]
MSTIHSPLQVDALSRFQAPGSAKQSRIEFYLLRTAQGLALAVFLSFCILWVKWQASATGVTKLSGDFISFWTAGQLALQGHAAEAYTKLPHFALQVELHHDPGWGYLAFFYPPFFLLLCAGFALLGFFPALCVWLLSTLACYVAALRALLPKGLREGMPVWVLLLGYPAVMINAGFGQNGFLSTALFGGAAVWLDRRPALAGVCLGSLAYKPQLGIIVPLALIVARRWRCFAFAAATVLALAAVATLAFGADIWPAFMAGMADARRDWMEPPNPLYLVYWITVFGAVRLHGGSLALAYGAQAAVSVAAAFMLVRALLRRAPGIRSGKAEVAAIAACVPFCSPFMLEYDLIILAVPMAWLLGEGLHDGFRRGELAALLAAYLAPALFKVSAFDNALKLGVIGAAALLFVMVLRRMTAPSMQSSGLDRAVPAA